MSQKSLNWFDYQRMLDPGIGEIYAPRQGLVVNDPEKIHAAFCSYPLIIHE